MNKKVIFISGPTAVGKTSVSIELAKKINGEIISADSMQIYEHFDIGSAKPTQEEMQGIKHYMIGEIDPRDEFSVSQYRHLAKQYIEEIFEKGKVPIIVGGTGLYINSLIYDMDFSNSASDPAYRAEIEQLAEEKGNQYVHDMLREKDPKAAEDIHPNNLIRVIRALEICHVTGGTKGDFKKDPVKTDDYDYVLVGLTRNRRKLYALINKRVDIMINNGLVEEIEGLKKLGLDDTFTSMQGIGYKEVLPYLNGKYDFDQMVTIIKTNSRRYAKRQFTWFKRYEDIHWVDVDQYENIEEILGLIEEF